MDIESMDIESMDIESTKKFDCFIICDTKRKQKKLLKKLQQFKGYECRGEGNESINMAVIKSKNIWLELEDGKRIPKQYFYVHEFLTQRGFMMKVSDSGTPGYAKSTHLLTPLPFSRWNVRIFFATKDERKAFLEDERRALVEDSLDFAGYTISAVASEWVEMWYYLGDEPKAAPEQYLNLYKSLVKRGYKKRPSDWNVLEFERPRGLLTTLMLEVRAITKDIKEDIKAIEDI